MCLPLRAGPIASALSLSGEAKRPMRPKRWAGAPAFTSQNDPRLPFCAAFDERQRLAVSFKDGD